MSEQLYVDSQPRFYRNWRSRYKTLGEYVRAIASTRSPWIPGAEKALIEEIATELEKGEEESLEKWREGFRAGWDSSGEGFNGEWPDEGVPWDHPDHAGAQAMRRAEEKL
ncbi:hypothetical protein PBI_DEWDROP_18 [Microbacterium phage Dewdrop]|nr:hypothetical protein PBI_LEAF_18 [Microbacterium phage Leaf]QGZ17387.1 hypothetical protein PBI_DEWDROP_18 [Microbacterium phage Dewdrop]